MQRESKAVAVHDVVDYGTTIAYSTVCGTLPTLVVATATDTIKTVSTLADHYTGNNAEVMRARIKAYAPQTV